MKTDDAQPASANAALCPLCAAPNGCALERRRASGVEQPPCWCTQVDFDQALLARIAPHERRLRCVCAACATRPLPSEARR